MHLALHIQMEIFRLLSGMQTAKQLTIGCLVLLDQHCNLEKNTYLLSLEKTGTKYAKPIKCRSRFHTTNFEGRLTHRI